MNWPLLEMSMLLQGDDMEKVFCPEHTVNKWGHRVLSCSLHLAHEDAHVDVHAGRKWE